MIWVSISLTIAVFLYTGFQLLYQFSLMWIVLPIVMLVSLVVLHKSARKRSFGLTSVAAIVATPLTAIVGLAFRTGFAGAGYLMISLLVGIALFVGLYLCLRKEQAGTS